MYIINVSRRYKITWKEAGIYFSLFFFFALLYYTTLWFNRGGNLTDKDPYFNLYGFFNWGGLDYLLKMLLSLPVVWLMFVRFPHRPFYQRLLLHGILLPLFVITWQKVYYLLTEALGMFHLTSLGSVWDLYIPALFYILEFGILHACFYFKDIQQQQKLEAELREAALQSELSALKAQLNPHFLYNVFNTINASIPPELEGTRQMIAELSDLFRYQLQASKSEYVTLGEELEFTRKYLALEKARLEERLQVNIEADKALLSRPVPPMLIQPLVENAVKHGIAPLIEGGTIRINAVQEGGRICVSVEDTGSGIEDKARLLGNGTGLTNTALRLQRMFGSTLQFTDTLPHGLTVNFIIG